MIGLRSGRRLGRNLGHDEVPAAGNGRYAGADTVLQGLAGVPTDTDRPSPAPETVPSAFAQSGVHTETLADDLLLQAPTMLQVDLVGMQLRATGLVDLGHFERLSDYVNLLEGFCQLREVTILTRSGVPTLVTLANLRLRLDDVMLVGQRSTEPRSSAPPQIVVKRPRRLIVMTAAHLVSGTAYLHEEASMQAFIDGDDPRFIPMTDVRVRWLADRRLTGRFAFALIQRSHVVGVATGA